MAYSEWYLEQVTLLLLQFYTTTFMITIDHGHDLYISSIPFFMLFHKAAPFDTLKPGFPMHEGIY